MLRRTAVATLATAAFVLAACGPGAGGDASKKGANPAMPPPDPARAAKVNGYDKDGKPIDAVAAAEMPESALPPLKGEGAGPPPDAPPAPPYKAPTAPQ